MSANSVLPPVGLTTRADSSENFAGMGRNELSECHRQLPRLNRCVRLSFASGLEPRRQPVVFRLRNSAAARILALTEVQRKSHLLLVVDVLIMEDEHRVC